MKKRVKKLGKYSARELEVELLRRAIARREETIAFTVKALEATQDKQVAARAELEKQLGLLETERKG